MSKEGVAFKSLVLATVGIKKLGWSGPLKLTIELHSPRWMTKKGLIHKRAGDCDNYAKVCCDALFACLPEMDDAQVFELVIVKRTSDSERTEFRVERLL